LKRRAGLKPKLSGQISDVGNSDTRLWRLLKSLDDACRGSWLQYLDSAPGIIIQAITQEWLF
jgi:hypothetical protein